MLASPILACFWAVAVVTADVAEEHLPEVTDQTFLLQQRQSIVSKPVATEHYWPHARGHVNRQSQAPHVSMPQDLNSSLLWRWDGPEDNIVWSTLVDRDRNLYISSVAGIWKLSPSGQVLWFSPTTTESSSLVGNTLVGMGMMDCKAFALDLETGNKLWENQLCTVNGAHGDFVEAHNGVAVVGAGMEHVAFNISGNPTTFLAGMDVTDGSLLWKFKAECGLWNVLALFPDDETTIFQDLCGGVYRLGLRNGTKIWYTKGEDNSFTDGGPVIAADGQSVYTCSNPAGLNGNVLDGSPRKQGLLRKYRSSDGARLWSADLPYPCVNFPGVSMDGQTVVVAPGALSTRAKVNEVDAVPEHLRSVFYHQQLSLVKSNTQRAFYGLPNLDAAIMGFDTATGALQWRHEVKPYGGLAFARDEERSWRFVNHKSRLPHCWPSHWSGPILDRDGVVYIARSTGEFYVYNPKTDKELTYHTGDGALMGGVASAPGMMLITTCNSVFAFKLPPPM